MIDFCQFSFEALSLFSLTYSWTLRVFLERSSIGSRKEKEGLRRQDKSKIRKGRVGSSGYNEIICGYPVACMISLLVFASVVLHVCSWLSCCHGHVFF